MEEIKELVSNIMETLKLEQQQRMNEMSNKIESLTQEFKNSSDGMKEDVDNISDEVKSLREKIKDNQDKPMKMKKKVKVLNEEKTGITNSQHTLCYIGTFKLLNNEILLFVYDLLN